MDWATRIKVAAGAAHGIAYLHEDCNFLSQFIIFDNDVNFSGSFFHNLHFFVMITFIRSSSDYS